MKIINCVLIPILVSCFAQTEKQKEPREVFIVNETHSDLSEVVAQLVNEPVEGYVLIHHSATEYPSVAKAREDTCAPKSIVRFETERLHLHTPLAEKDDDHYNWGSPLVFRQVITDHGDVVEVNTMNQDLLESLGHGGRGADYIFNLVTFVRKIDLLPVISVPYKKEFDDKTQIKLYPGVAIGIPWKKDNTKRAVSVQQMYFEFSIPDRILALSYKPILHELKNIDRELMLNEKATLLLDGKEFSPVAEIRLARLRTPVNHDKNADKHIVELVANGIEMTLQTDDDLVKSYIPNIDRPLLTPRFETPPRWLYRVQQGTPVYWDDGRVAGEVRQYFTYQSEIAPGDSTWCEIISEFLPNEPLCFKIKDIEIIDNENNN